VPRSIDASGASDVSAELATFIAAVPDGTTITFEPDGTYRVDSGLTVSGRRNLRFAGNGATLRGTGCSAEHSLFRLRSSDRIVIRGFRLEGGNQRGGTPEAFQPGCESQAGVSIYGSTNVEIADVAISATTGECVYVDAADPDYVWSDTVWFHDSTCDRNGRMGVAIAAARNVIVERVAFSDIAMFVLDIEPYAVNGGAIQIAFRHNVVRRYGLTRLFTNWFVAAEGVPGSLVTDMTISGNTVVEGAPPGANPMTDAGLATTIRVPRRARIAFTGNVTSTPGRGPVLYFAHIDGLTVSDNVQPLAGGRLAVCADCTDVLIRP
jgi:hypothetical protein